MIGRSHQNPYEALALEIEKHGNAFLDLEGYLVLLERNPGDSYTGVIWVNVGVNNNGTVTVGDIESQTIEGLLSEAMERLALLPWSDPAEVIMLAKQHLYEGRVEGLYALERSAA